MRIRTYLTLLTVLFFGILAGASFDEDGSLSGLVWIILAVFVVGFIFTLFIATNKEEHKIKKRIEETNAEYEVRKRRIVEEEKVYNQWLTAYVRSNGDPDKTIIIKPYNISGVIHVHEASKKVFIQGKEYSFNDIISCSFTDNQTTIKGKITSATKSSTGSTVGRAIIGDIVAGPAGAIIGGTTSKKTTEFHQENDRIVHNYTVFINVNSIASPILQINTGADEKLANEIVGLMNVIISRK